MRETWPYRADLDCVAVAPDGSVASYTLAWLDEENRVGEFEPVGTHEAHQRRGLGRAVNLFALQRLRDEGATEALVGCRGDDAYPIPRKLYESVGFRELAATLSFRAPARIAVSRGQTRDRLECQARGQTPGHGRCACPAPRVGAGSNHPGVFQSAFDLLSQPPEAYLIVFALALGDGVFPAFPSESIVIVAGLLSVVGDLSLGWVIARRRASAPSPATTSPTRSAASSAAPRRSAS